MLKENLKIDNRDLDYGLNLCGKDIYIIQTHTQQMRVQFLDITFMYILTRKLMLLSILKIDRIKPQQKIIIKKQK